MAIHILIPSKTKASYLTAISPLDASRSGSLSQAWAKKYGKGGTNVDNLRH
jgi:hypothetical protein